MRRKRLKLICGRCKKIVKPKGGSSKNACSCRRGAEWLYDIEVKGEIEDESGM